MIWNQQTISAGLYRILESWVASIDEALRRTAGNRMVSEWAKKVGCWDAVRELSFDLPGKPVARRSQMPDDELRL